MSNSDVETLLTFYQLEKQNLERLIAECVIEEEFQIATYYSNALQQVKFTIRTFQNLADNEHDRKEWIKEKIAISEKECINSMHTSLYELQTQQINQLKEELVKLETPQKETKIADDFEHIFYDLIDGLIKGFRFYLKKEDDMYLLFTKHADTIFISFGSVDESEAGDFDHLIQLKSLGFYFDENKRCFEYAYNLFTFKNTLFIKTLISRIVFEVFYFKTLDLNTTIEIY